MGANFTSLALNVCLLDLLGNFQGQGNLGNMYRLWDESVKKGLEGSV